MWGNRRLWIFREPNYGIVSAPRMEVLNTMFLHYHQSYFAVRDYGQQDSQSEIEKFVSNWGGKDWCNNHNIKYSGPPSLSQKKLSNVCRARNCETRESSFEWMRSDRLLNDPTCFVLIGILHKRVPTARKRLSRTLGTGFLCTNYCNVYTMMPNGSRLWTGTRESRY